MKINTTSQFLYTNQKAHLRFGTILLRKVSDNIFVWQRSQNFVGMVIFQAKILVVLYRNCRTRKTLFVILLTIKIVGKVSSIAILNMINNREYFQNLLNNISHSYSLVIMPPARNAFRNHVILSDNVTEYDVFF